MSRRKDLEKVRQEGWRKAWRIFEGKGITPEESQSSERRLTNCPYRLTLWPLAVCWRVRTCTKRAVLSEKMLRGAGPRRHAGCQREKS